MPHLAPRLLVAGVAIGISVTTGIFVARPSPSEQNATDTAARFAFEVIKLNSAPTGAKHVRAVVPRLDATNGWISAVGAAVALTDLRGLGRSTDPCLVDPRDDSVRLLPVPNAGGPGYEPIELVPDGLPYDSTMAPMGCTPADLDEDGDVAPAVYYWGRSPVIFFNTGETGKRRFRATELVEPVAVWNSTGLDAADALDIAASTGEPDLHATYRVWTIGEAVRKAGMDEPSLIDVTADGLVVLGDGESYVLSARVDEVVVSVTGARP